MWKPVWKDINILKLKDIFFNKLGVLIDGDFKGVSMIRVDLAQSQKLFI